MKRLIPACLIVSLCAPCTHAGPTEAAIVAAMRLSEQPSYSWVAVVSDDARTYDIIGKTTRSGFTHVKMPVINSVRRKLGRSVTDTQIGMIFRGNVDCVIETDEGWKRPVELPLLPLDETEARPVSAVAGQLVSGSALPGRPMSGLIIAPKVVARKDAASRAYSNLQLAISHPHEDLGVIVGSHATFNVNGNVVSGVLTELGAQLLLVRDGQKYISPLRAEGTFKLWLRDGMVSKYQVKLHGALNVHLPTGRKVVEVNQVTETMVTDVGTTRVEIPDEARTKLGS